MPGDDLRSNYARTYDGRLEPGDRPGLLLVDMVEAYLREDSPFYCATASAAAETAAKLLAFARERAWPIVHSRVRFRPGGADGGVFYRKVPALSAFDEGSPLGAFPPALEPAKGELVITKQFPSAFFATGLADRLHAADVDTLAIAGFSTSGCVRASVVDAMQHGFVPYVVADACADRAPEPHEANLFDLGAKYAEVVTLDEFRDIFG